MHIQDATDAIGLISYMIWFGNREILRGRNCDASRQASYIFDLMASIQYMASKKKGRTFQRPCLLLLSL